MLRWILTYIFQTILLIMQLLPFKHIQNFIHWMYDNNLFIKYGILYDTTVGCSKQYRFANAMWLLGVLKSAYIVIMYICIDDPGRGRIKIYGINRSNKTYFKKTICMIVTEESNKYIMRMNSASMICEKNQELKFKMFAEECFKLCSYRNRKTRVKVGLNHKRGQDVDKFNKRQYHPQKKIVFNT